MFFFFKQKTAYEMRISDWSSDVCSSDLYSIVFYLSAGVLGGIAPFYTAAVTRSDPHERARLARIGWMTVGLLAALTVPVVWLAPLWLRYCGLEPGLLDAGGGYKIGRAHV